MAPLFNSAVSIAWHCQSLERYPVVEWRMPTLLEGSRGTVLLLIHWFQYRVMQQSLVLHPVPWQMGVWSAASCDQCCGHRSLEVASGT